MNKKEEIKKVSKITDSENIEAGNGINLIPKPSTEQIVVEKKKATLNIGSVLSLLALLIITIVIIGFNIISKIRLNTYKENLALKTAEVEQYTQKIIDNEEILNRIMLYKYIEKSAYSPRKVFEYIYNIASKIGSIEITNFEFGTELSFKFSGKTTDLERVSKLWYLLSVDEKVESIVLDSVSKSEDGVRFEFVGDLIFESFVNSD